MNNKLEACRSCQVQCVLEKDMSDLVNKAESQKWELKLIKEKISLASLKANKNNCPSSEISRTREEVLSNFYPKLAKTLTEYRTLNLQVIPSGEQPKSPTGFHNNPSGKSR